MNIITMITDMLRKRFGAEPQTGATLMPLTMPGSDHATPPFWTECLTAVSNKLHSRNLAEISWKGEFYVNRSMGAAQNQVKKFK